MSNRLIIAIGVTDFIAISLITFYATEWLTLSLVVGACAMMLSTAIFINNKPVEQVS